MYGRMGGTRTVIAVMIEHGSDPVQREWGAFSRDDVPVSETAGVVRGVLRVLCWALAYLLVVAVMRSVL